MFVPVVILARGYGAPPPILAKWPPPCTISPAFGCGARSAPSPAYPGMTGERRGSAAPAGRERCAPIQGNAMLLFASDVHLAAHRPGAVAAFLEFLSGPVRRAERLYLLGDVFDLWLGDDDTREPHPEVEAALAETVASGTPIDLLRGNHDFLAGDAFAERTGCRLTEEPLSIEVAGERVVLLHGDTLCTRDVEYQAYRRHVRDPANQRAFLARPLEERLREAAGLRATSNTRSRLKPDDITDVAEDEVARVLSEHGAAWMIHGHTHRPAVHRLDLETGPATRVVLGDWYERGTVLVWDGAGCRLASPGGLPA